MIIARWHSLSWKRQLGIIYAVLVILYVLFFGQTIYHGLHARSCMDAGVENYCGGEAAR